MMTALSTSQPCCTSICCLGATAHPLMCCGVRGMGQFEDKGHASRSLVAKEGSMKSVVSSVMAPLAKK